MKKKIFKATFRGILAFPIDMLRYDNCWPSTSEDAAKIHENLGSRGEEQEFLNITVTSEQDFTWSRWSSFGWTRVLK